MISTEELALRKSVADALGLNDLLVDMYSDDYVRTPMTAEEMEKVKNENIRRLSDLIRYKGEYLQKGGEYDVDKVLAGIKTKDLYTIFNSKPDEAEAWHKNQYYRISNGYPERWSKGKYKSLAGRQALTSHIAKLILIDEIEAEYWTRLDNRGAGDSRRIMHADYLHCVCCEIIDKSDEFIWDVSICHANGCDYEQFNSIECHKCGCEAIGATTKEAYEDFIKGDQS